MIYGLKHFKQDNYKIILEALAEPTLKDRIHFAISDIEDEKFLEAILVILNYTLSNNKESNNNNTPIK